MAFYCNAIKDICVDTNCSACYQFDGSGGSELSNDLLGLIRQWIPVSERLPEKDGYYIVKIKGENEITMLRYYFIKNSWEDDYFDVSYPVTHWMPLPAPPKGACDG